MSTLVEGGIMDLRGGNPYGMQLIQDLNQPKDPNNKLKVRGKNRTA